jgi:hypothetical protein
MHRTVEHAACVFCTTHQHASRVFHVIESGMSRTVEHAACVFCTTHQHASRVFHVIDQVRGSEILLTDKLTTPGLTD